MRIRNGFLIGTRMQMNRQDVFAAILIGLAWTVVLYYIIHSCGGMSEERWVRIF